MLEMVKLYKLHSTLIRQKPLTRINRLNLMRHCVGSISKLHSDQRHKQPCSFTNWTFQTFPKRLENNRPELSHYSNEIGTTVALTFFGKCKFTPSSELDDISSTDRKIQSFWRYPVGVLRVNSSTKKWLTIKLLVQLLGQKCLRYFLRSQIKMQTDVTKRESSRGMVGHQRNNGHHRNRGF